MFKITTTFKTELEIEERKKATEKLVLELLTECKQDWAQNSDKVFIDNLHSNQKFIFAAKLFLESSHNDLLELTKLDLKRLVAKLVYLSKFLSELKIRGKNRSGPTRGTAISRKRYDSELKLLISLRKKQIKAVATFREINKKTYSSYEFSPSIEALTISAHYTREAIGSFPKFPIVGEMPLDDNIAMMAKFIRLRLITHYVSSYNVDPIDALPIIPDYNNGLLLEFRSVGDDAEELQNHFPNSDEYLSVNQQLDYLSYLVLFLRSVGITKYNRLSIVTILRRRRKETDQRLKTRKK